jgi:A/G-specific adenine glycosylase
MSVKEAGQINRGTILDRDKVKWLQDRLKSWHAQNARTFPWRETRDPYRILIAEVLLQATFAAKVVPVYEEFTRCYPTAHSLSQTSVDEIKAIIRPLGLLSRAQTLLEIGKSLVELYGGVVPSESDKLRILPKVGDYTIGAVQSFGFGLRAGIPDTNVIRLLQRFFGLYNPRKSHRGSPPKALRVAAYEVLPMRDSRALNYAMLDFGALVCTSLKPKCRQCPLSTRCIAYTS